MSNAIVEATYNDHGYIRQKEEDNTTVGHLDPKMINTNNTEYTMDGFTTTEAEVNTALAGRFFANT